MVLIDPHEIHGDLPINIILVGWSMHHQRNNGSKMERAMYRAMVSSEILTAILRVKHNFKIPSGVFAEFQSYLLQYCISSDEKCQKIKTNGIIPYKLVALFCLQIFVIALPDFS